MADTVRNPEPADAIDEWLAAEPDPDMMVELGALRAHLDSLSGGAKASEARLLLQMAARALDVASRLRPRLLTARLPLSRELHVAAETFVGLSCDLAAELWRIEELRESRWLRLGRDEAEDAGGEAFALLCEAHVVLCMSGVPAPEGFWRSAHALSGFEGGRAPGQGVDDAVALRLFLYRRMLAAAVAQPESLTPRESSWLFDYLDAIAMHAQLSPEPIVPAAAAYWIDPSLDRAPVAVGRRPPPEEASLRYFSPAPLVSHAREHAEWLEMRMMEAELSGLEVDGEPLAPDVVGLPLGLAPGEILSLLRRLRDRWAMPPMREQPRRRHQYAVHVCVGLRALWELGRGEFDVARIGQWMVLNESPGGYAIMCVSGVEGTVEAGMVVALRREAAEPWTICLVRWARSDGPDQVELGLQILSLGFASIQLGFRGSEVRSAAPGLLLPAMKPLRPNDVILAPAGTYKSRRFVFVREGPSLYVAQGRALGLDMQTANIEMFQYEVDPYAL
ncbi:MAG: hypothetical protein JSR40_10185 [Proteobacteria bacterium]|nr:hypothetical protein [Pseudomonadota bacterium]